MKWKNLLLLLLVLSIAGCKSNPVQSDYKDVFSIYLVKDSNLSFTEEKPPINEMILEVEPLLTINSIENYDWNKHQISFSEETKEELKKKEPLLHYLFVIIANNERVYWGMFLDGADSYGCSNPVICLIPRNPSVSSFIPNGFIINRAYPSYSGNESEKDIREDIRIYNALKNVNKLVK